MLKHHSGGDEAGHNIFLSYDKTLILNRTFLSSHLFEKVYKTHQKR